MSKAKRELMKAYPDAKMVRRIGNSAEWTMTLLDGRAATVRVHAMAGKLTAIKAGMTLERLRIEQDVPTVAVQNAVAKPCDPKENYRLSDLVKKYERTVDADDLDGNGRERE